MSDRKIRIDAKPTVGLRFGKLVAVDALGRDHLRRLTYRCVCDCGGEKIVTHNNLHNRLTTSCGCARGRRLPPGRAALNALYARIRHGAEDAPFDLSLAQVQMLTSSPCHYCGDPPSQVTGLPTNNGTYTYNSITRLDPAKGYTLLNTVPCCGDCARAKCGRIHIEFMSWIKKVHARHPA